MSDLNLILGSSSPYRKSLLEKLGIPFECRSPEIDESALENEQPIALVERLAVAKAQEIARTLDTARDTSQGETKPQNPHHWLGSSRGARRSHYRQT